MQDSLQEIKNAVTMRDFCDCYGLPVNRAGFIRCPFHGEKTASLKIYPGSRGWHCFGCGRGGDVVAFTEMFFDVDFKGALSKLNADFNLGLPLTDNLTDAEKAQAKKAADERRRQQEQLRKRLQQAREAYFRAFERFTAYDKAISENAPKTPFDAPDAEYIEAVKNIDRAAYELDLAAEKLRKIEAERR